MRLLLILMFALLAGEALAQGTPPQHIDICASSNCIRLVKNGEEYSGHGVGNMPSNWRFFVTQWSLEHIVMAGVEIDGSGKATGRVVAVNGKPEIWMYAEMKTKAVYRLGKKTNAEKVTVTWDIPEPKGGIWRH